MPTHISAQRITFRDVGRRHLQTGSYCDHNVNNTAMWWFGQVQLSAHRVFNLAVKMKYILYVSLMGGWEVGCNFKLL